MVENQLTVWDDELVLEKVEFDLSQRFVYPIKISGLPTLPSKPRSALWTSTFKEETRTSEWTEWCQFEDFHLGGRFFLLRAKPETRLLTVRTEDDERHLPLQDGQIDFAELADWGFDGLRTLRWRSDSLFDRWSCESTAWFNTDWIESVEEIFLPHIVSRA